MYKVNQFFLKIKIIKKEVKRRSMGEKYFNIIDIIWLTKKYINKISFKILKM